MKRLVLVLVLTGLVVSPAMAQFLIAPDGTTLPDGTVNFVVPAPPPGFGHTAGTLPYGAHSILYMSRYYWASYPMTMAPGVPPTGPVDAWAESVGTSR
jgi:hypothetical protein